LIAASWERSSGLCISTTIHFALGAAPRFISAEREWRPTDADIGKAGYGDQGACVAFRADSQDWAWRGRSLERRAWRRLQTPEPAAQSIRWDG
jgi:hypothetical protein